MQNWGKGVFLAIFRNIGYNMMDKSRKTMKKDMYLAYRVCLPPILGNKCLKVLFRRMISTPKYEMALLG